MSIFERFFADAGTNQFSWTKFWNNVGNGVTTGLVIYYALCKSLDFGWVLAWLGCVGTSAAASKVVSMKMAAVGLPQPESETK